MHDQMQPVFDGAEAIQTALHSQAGCEMALYDILDTVLCEDRRTAQIVYAIFDSMSLFRQQAEENAARILNASLGR